MFRFLYGRWKRYTNVPVLLWDDRSDSSMVDENREN